MDLLPGSALVRVDGAVGDLQAFHRLRRGGKGGDLHVLLDLGEHLPLHVAIDLRGGRRQLDLDRVDDRLADVEVVGQVDRQADVLELVLDLALRVGQRLDHCEAGRRGDGLEPAVNERLEREPEPLALIHEPRESPHIFKAPGRGRSGEADVAGRGVSVSGQRLGALGALPGPIPLEARGLVGHDHLEWPAVAAGGG